MLPFAIPEFKRLRGEEALWALFGFLEELGEERGKELTESQINALTKLVRGLISSIEAEMLFSASERDIRETCSITHLERSRDTFQNQSAKLSAHS